MSVTHYLLDPTLFSTPSDILFAKHRSFVPPFSPFSLIPALLLKHTFPTFNYGAHLEPQSQGWRTKIALFGFYEILILCLGG